MNYEAKDVKESETCKSSHKYQYIEVNQKGESWQYCIDCDRKLRVR